MRHRYSILFFPLHILLDIFCLNVSFAGAYWLKYQNFTALTELHYNTLWWIFNGVWLAVILATKPYIFPRQLFKVDHLLRKFIMLMTLHMAAISFFLVMVLGYYYSRQHLLLTYVLFFLTGSAYRIGGLIFLKEFRARGFNDRKYVVVGFGKLSTSITRFYDVHPELGFHFAGYFDWPTADNSHELAGDYNNLLPYIKEAQVDCVYCCLPYVDNQRLKQLVDGAEIYNYQVKLLVDFRGFLTKGTSVEYHDFLPVLSVSSQILEDFRVNFLKRSFDITFSLVMLTLGSPVFAVVALLTRFTSKGPIFYSQERIGQQGKPFAIYKFRSMYTDAEHMGPALSQGLHDRRITPWGQVMRRTRLDELPQFYNVLKGDMSVVGPRPERQYFINQIVDIAPEYQNLLKVKPGITSIGQIKFGYAGNVDEMVQRLRYDLLYPERRSFAFDMWIIAQTVRVMMQGRGK